MGEIFENFDVNPLGSASIAQVHRARLRGDKNDVVVKVQHPGIQDLMMTDIRNLQAFVLYIQMTDIKFDLFSITKEMEKQRLISNLICFPLPRKWKNKYLHSHCCSLQNISILLLCIFQIM